MEFKALTALPSGNDLSGTQWIGDWADPKTGMDAFEQRRIFAFAGS
jgi:hypothetical protein